MTRRVGFAAPATIASASASFTIIPAKYSGLLTNLRAAPTVIVSRPPAQEEA